MPPETSDVDLHVPATDETVNSVWDNSLEPVATIESGAVVRFDCRDATSGQLHPDATVEDIAELDIDQVHGLTGPIALEDAQPGDVLEVEILDLEHQGWGYTVVLPGEVDLGVLAAEFPAPALHVWEFDDGVAKFVDGIEVPIDPFPGIIGVAPATDGRHDTLPPRSTGGNIDVKHLTAGSTVYLPVAVEDGLFSIGDCHAAQGDGEVCGTAIEAPMSVTCRITLREDMTIDQPQLETSGPFTPTGGDEPMYATTGVDDTLDRATKKAVAAMVEHLQDEHDLSREHAYILCSAAVDLKISEAVSPNRVVTAYLPTSIFP